MTRSDHSSLTGAEPESTLLVSSSISNTNNRNLKMCVRVCVCVRACVRVCMHACVSGALLGIHPSLSTTAEQVWVKAQM